MKPPFVILILTRNHLVVAMTLFLVVGNCACRRGSTKNANTNGSVPSSAGEAEADKSNREAQTLVDQGKEFYKNGNQDEQAAQAFQEAIRLSPDLAEAHLRLGMAYAALDKKTEAEQSYKKAVELYKRRVQSDPKDAKSFFYLGQAHSLLHQDEEATRAFRQATRLKPDDEEAFYQLGMSETRLAHYPEAIAAFQEALELDPDDYRATDALETAQEGAKRIKEGKKHAEEMLKKQQENANANGNANSNTKPAPKHSPSKPW